MQSQARALTARRGSWPIAQVWETVDRVPWGCAHPCPQEPGTQGLPSEGHIAVGDKQKVRGSLRLRWVERPPAHFQNSPKVATLYMLLIQGHYAQVVPGTVRLVCTLNCKKKHLICCIYVEQEQVAKTMIQLRSNSGFIPGMNPEHCCTKICTTLKTQCSASRFASNASSASNASNAKICKRKPSKRQKQ
eukprot:scaffold82577_cov18-Tisochrysis_lutea.AAC.1